MAMNDKQLIEYLKQFVSQKRLAAFDRVIEYRTKYLTVLLEDIYQPHNASAVLRTCDCYGIQDVHIVENRNQYQVNPDVALGSDKWLNMTKYEGQGNNTKKACDKLRKNGYRIVATSLHKGNETSLLDFNLETGKVAIMLGTEMHGLSDIALEEADEYLKIPLYGFTESFNISVSAAIILHEFVSRLHRSEINWQLTEKEKESVYLNWLRKTIKKSELLEKQFREMKNS